ncbi:MAG: aminotransferase class III-fold pyridoxal phosphate-dependent enzyme, partial [Alphaproteobacteria bacterium]
MRTEAQLRNMDASFIHPWHPFDYLRENAPAFVNSAKGCHLYDASGKRYFDAVGGLWCTNIGAGREDMAKAIYDQVLKLSYGNPFGNLSHEPAVELSEKLASLAPSHLNHIYYGCGGSDVIDSAVRMIHYYQNIRGKHKKKHLISRKNSYHGTTYVTQSMGAIATNRDVQWDFITDWIHHVRAAYTYRDCPDGATEEEYTEILVKDFEDKIAELGGPDHVAAFFAEPVMGGGGVLPPPRTYLNRMAQVCRENDILFVADEVVTGFGRLGHWFASEGEFGIKPDIIATAKGLTSGYQPLGAGFVSDEVWEVLAEPGSGRVMSNGFTYSAHTVACAAALKNIEIIETENIFNNVDTVGRYFQEQIETLEEFEIVGDARGIKFMMGIEYVSNKTSKAHFPAEVGIAARVAKEAYARGVIARPAYHLNILSPALVATRDDVDHCVSGLREGIKAATVALRK